MPEHTTDIDPSPFILIYTWSGEERNNNIYITSLPSLISLTRLVQRHNNTINTPASAPRMTKTIVPITMPAIAAGEKIECSGKGR